jgi:hypothetical protein
VADFAGLAIHDDERRGMSESFTRESIGDVYRRSMASP